MSYNLKRMAQAFIKQQIYIYIPYVWWLCRKIFDVVICRRGEERQEKSSREGAFCSSSCLPSSRHSAVIKSSGQSALSTSGSAVALVALMAFFCSYVLVLFIILCPPLQSCVLSQSPEQSASSTSGSAVALVALITNFYSLMVLLCIFLCLVLSNVYDFGFKILRFDSVFFRLLRAMPCWL